MAVLEQPVHQWFGRFFEFLMLLFSHIVFSHFVFMPLPPNKSPEPTAVGAVSSAVAVRVASRRWLSFLR
jgi:hypothetical protein